MPNLADITVKKNDGTTDIVYTGVVPSAGDKSPAIWRSNSVGTAQAHKPELLVSGQFNGPRTARRLTIKYFYPSLVTGSDGRTSVSDRAIADVTVTLPQGMADTDINEFGSQFVNLLASSLGRSMVKSGYAAT